MSRTDFQMRPMRPRVMLIASQVIDGDDAEHEVILDDRRGVRT